MLHLKNTIKQSKAKIFKTKKFSKIADKACIFEADLCKAISQVMVGQVVDLGGGVYKKRLNSNAHRSIILSKGAKFWIFQHLFAKLEISKMMNWSLFDRWRKHMKIYRQNNFIY